ncbi:MAG: hypothetical protein P4M09_03950 [Devosia sp.]|nr:hypothetical protein [Devosia sp.]
MEEHDVPPADGRVNGRHIRRGTKGPKWLLDLLARRPFKVAAVALANKMARIVYALLIGGEDYRMAGKGAGGRETVATA